VKPPVRLIQRAERVRTGLSPIVPTASQEDRSTAESMKSVGPGDLVANRGWFGDEEAAARSGEFSLWDEDEAPAELPESHPDRSSAHLDTTTLAPAVEREEPPTPTLWTRSGMFQAGLALLGLFFVTAPTVLTVGLDALDEAMDPCRADEAPIASWEADRAALLVEQIWASPGDTTCLLAARGMERGDFLALMEDISSDLTLASSFEAALPTARDRLAEKR